MRKGGEEENRAMKQLVRIFAGLVCAMGGAQAEVVAPDVLIRNTVDEVIAIIKQDIFFQAEDGIRDLLVTGVQTCALPVALDDNRGGERPTLPGLRVSNGFAL